MHRNLKRKRSHDDATDGGWSSFLCERRKRMEKDTVCNTCRKGRRKCDGKTPVCGYCETNQRECSYPFQRPNANFKIRELEKEIQRLRALHRANNITDDGGTGPAFRSTSPLTSASSDRSSFLSSISGSLSPWSTSSLPSPLPLPSGESLDVPGGEHVKSDGDYVKGDEFPRDGHTGVPQSGLYGNSLDGTHLAAATLTTTTWIPPSPVGTAEHQEVIGLAYPNSYSGPNACAVAVQGPSQIHGISAGSFDIDTSVHFADLSLDTAYRIEE